VLKKATMSTEIPSKKGLLNWYIATQKKEFIHLTLSFILIISTFFIKSYEIYFSIGFLLTSLITFKWQNVSDTLLFAYTLSFPYQNYKLANLIVIGTLPIVSYFNNFRIIKYTMKSSPVSSMLSNFFVLAITKLFGFDWGLKISILALFIMISHQINNFKLTNIILLKFQLYSNFHCFQNFLLSQNKEYEITSVGKDLHVETTTLDSQHSKEDTVKLLLLDFLTQQNAPESDLIILFSFLPIFVFKGANFMEILGFRFLKVRRQRKPKPAIYDLDKLYDYILKKQCYIKTKKEMIETLCNYHSRNIKYLSLKQVKFLLQFQSTFKQIITGCKPDALIERCKKKSQYLPKEIFINLENFKVECRTTYNEIYGYNEDEFRKDKLFSDRVFIQTRGTYDIQENCIGYKGNPITNFSIKRSITVADKSKISSMICNKPKVIRKLSQKNEVIGKTSYKRISFEKWYSSHLLGYNGMKKFKRFYPKHRIWSALSERQVSKLTYKQAMEYHLVLRKELKKTYKPETIKIVKNYVKKIRENIKQRKNAAVAVASSQKTERKLTKKEKKQLRADYNKKQKASMKESKKKEEILSKNAMEEVNLLELQGHDFFEYDDF